MEQQIKSEVVEFNFDDKFPVSAGENSVPLNELKLVNFKKGIGFLCDDKGFVHGYCEDACHSYQ